MKEGLPRAWVWATPSQVGWLALGKMLDRNKHRFGHSLPYLRNINVRWGKVELDDLYEMFFKDDELDRYGIEDGDLLICEGGEPGRCAVWNKGETKLKFQKALHRFRAGPGVNPHFLMYQIQLDAKIGSLERSFTGSTIKHFTAQSLAKYRFKLAPAQEQDRIVEKLDELFSQIEAGEEALDRVQKLLERYRQSVLNAAVTGELTRVWREQHKGGLESGEALLKRIFRARRGAWENAELARMRARGKPPKDDRWKQKYKEPVPPDTTDLPALPEGWVWASLDQLTSSFGNGLSRKPKDTPPGQPILRISSVRPLQIDPNDHRYYQGQQNEKLADYILQHGDLLFTRYNGSPRLVGVCGIWEVDLSMVFPDKIMRARAAASGNLVIPQFVSLCANTGASRRFIEKRIRTSAGQHGISGKDVRSAPIPLPTTEEQILIAEATDKALSHAAHTVGDLAGSRRSATVLRQAILSAALAGQLVPQDPTEEPASLLLERAAVAQDGGRKRRRRSSKAGDRQAHEQLELLG